MGLIETNPGVSLFFALEIAELYGELVPELEIRDRRQVAARQYLIDLAFNVISKQARGLRGRCLTTQLILHPAILAISSSTQDPTPSPPVWLLNPSSPFID